MNPAQTERKLKEKIIGYLDRTLPIKRKLPQELSRKFEEFQQNGMSFVRSPYIETSKSYQFSDHSLRDMVDEGLLELPVAKAFASYWGGTIEGIKPYLHQYRSVEAVQNGQNLVVCTGTGSGKTECFLLPVINSIYRQHQQAQREGTVYQRHIRAMILYPMNALVNDQLNRLRRILKELPEITFGRYTGETEKEIAPVDVARERVEQLNARWKDLPKSDGHLRDEAALRNEYRDKKQWVANRAAGGGGADILVTNFAMLERLMLVPGNGFFDECWDFIVLDEAHCYTGSSGT